MHFALTQNACPRKQVLLYRAHAALTLFLLRVNADAA